MKQWYKVPPIRGVDWGTKGVSVIYHFRDNPTSPALGTVYKVNHTWFGFASVDTKKEIQARTAEGAKLAVELLI
jgi:hypothetical protein